MRAVPDALAVGQLRVRRHPAHLPLRWLVLGSLASLAAALAGITFGAASLPLRQVMAELANRLPLVELRSGLTPIDAAILTYVRRSYGIAIGERTAEAIKIALGSAHPSFQDLAAEVRGRELASGLPKTVLLTGEEVREAIREPVTAIIDSVLRCLGSAPPELARDLISRGICLVGGGGLLRGLDVALAEACEVPVYRVDAPLECVVLGAGHCIESFNVLRGLLSASRS